jgi:hypothetical protein
MCFLFANYKINKKLVEVKREFKGQGERAFTKITTITQLQA